MATNTTPKVNPIMHPTHGGMELLVGTDVTGLHIYMFKHMHVEMGPTELHWHVVKFPLELWEGIRAIMDGSSDFASFDVGMFAGQVKEIEKDQKIKFTLYSQDEGSDGGFDFSITLNGAELLQLYNALRNHFCY